MTSLIKKVVNDSDAPVQEDFPEELSEVEKEFLSDLQALCYQYDMTIFAGAFGLRFVARDKDGMGTENQNLNNYYFTQAFDSKVFIVSEVSK